MTELPTEIIVDILTRLRPKPLCHFKCVAKSWNSLISSSYFVKLHLNKTLLSQNSNLILSYDSLSAAELSDTDTFLRFSPLDHPIEHLPNHPTVQLMGTVNGIAFISDRFRKTLFLFNPLTKQTRLIPPVPSLPTNIPVFHPVDHIMTFGFGYSESDDDYKILSMVWSYAGKVETSREVRLYSLRNDSWKRVKDNCNRCTHPLMNGVHINGCLFFAVNDENENFVVKCFNLKDEMFIVIDMCEYGKVYRNFSCVLGELGGCLSVMGNYELGGQLGGRQLAWAILWIRDGGWVRLFNLIRPKKIGCSKFVKPIVYSKDRGRVLLEIDRCMLGWYDWKSEKFERVDVIGLSPWVMHFDTSTYVPSLVSLKMEKGKEKEKTVPKEKVKEKEKTVPKEKEKTLPKEKVKDEGKDNTEKAKEKVKDDDKETETVEAKSMSKKEKKKEAKKEKAKERETLKEKAKGKSVSRKSVNKNDR